MSSITDKAQKMRQYIEQQAVNLSDDEALALPEVFPEWEEDEGYQGGDRVMFEGTLYKCVQGHVAQPTWKPDDAPSLWAEVLNHVVDDVVPEWKQPDSTNAYMAGDVVMFEGGKYESTIDNNVWSPTAYPGGWKKLD